MISLPLTGFGKLNQRFPSERASKCGRALLIRRIHESDPRAVARTVIQGGLGAVELAFRDSHIDLTDGTL